MLFIFSPSQMRASVVKLLFVGLCLSFSSIIGWTPNLLSPALADDAKQTACADPRPLNFPRDHGAHRCYQTEWWYYTGHLVEETLTGVEGTEDREKSRESVIFSKPSDFGFQFTIFRRGDDDGANDKFMAHGALSKLSTNGKRDVSSREFSFSQVLGQEGLGLAGASNHRLEVWVQDWKAEQFGGKHIIEYELKDGAKVRLIAEEVQAPVLNGEDGKSRKADCERCFSYYYSLPQLKISGEIIKEDIIRRVSGVGWMDHEFMTGAMEPGTIGWDWFSLYWPDGSSLMAFQLRRAGKKSYLAGTHIAANGVVTKLSGEEISLTPLEQWKSRRGVKYPIKWQLGISKLGLNLEVNAIINGQVLEPEQVQTIESLAGSKTNSQLSQSKLPSEYWEGAIEDQKHSIKGYLEMTGYERPIGEMM